MRLLFLDEMEEQSALCLLCRATLRSYVEALGDDFKNYFVQRSIVTNKYLDELWETISNKRHIPTIVLVAERPQAHPDQFQEFTLPAPFKVLDGLQRSYRLKVIWNTIRFLEGDFIDDTSMNPTQVARKNSERLKELECAPSLFVRMLQAKRELADHETLTALFELNSIWLEVWIGLSQNEQIQKMLVLNAGHKSVNIKHQIELLFIEYLEVLQRALPGCTIHREKDLSAQKYSKTRSQKHFHFAHLISAFESLNVGRPITTNSEFSASRAFPKEEEREADALLGVDVELIEKFARTLAVLDNRLGDKLGITWLGREVVLVGLFGAIGRYGMEHLASAKEALQRFEDHVGNYVESLDLSSFERMRNSLELSKVNIGAKNKRAVYEATLEFLEGPAQRPFDWQRYFEG